MCVIFFLVWGVRFGVFFSFYSFIFSVSGCRDMFMELNRIEFVLLIFYFSVLVGGREYFLGSVSTGGNGSFRYFSTGYGRLFGSRLV